MNRIAAQVAAVDSKANGVGGDAWIRQSQCIQGGVNTRGGLINGTSAIGTAIGVAIGDQHNRIIPIAVSDTRGDPGV